MCDISAKAKLHGQTVHLHAIREKQYAVSKRKWIHSIDANWWGIVMETQHTNDCGSIAIDPILIVWFLSKR